MKNKNAKEKIQLIFYIILCYLVFPNSAHAMHISEGVLPLHWAGFWFAIALPFIAWGLVDLKKRSSSDLSLKLLLG